MPNLKDIRRRIKSVKSTQKITQAMRMVAAAKVKRAETLMRAARPFSDQLREVFVQVYNRLKNQTGALEGSKYTALFSPRPVQNVGIIVMSSDRGLCGAYNASVIRRAIQLEKRLLAEGLTPHFYLVGNKVIQAFHRYSKSPVLGRIANMTAAPSFHDARVVAETVLTAFLDGKIDSIEVLSTRFKSMISSSVDELPLVPVDKLRDGLAEASTTPSTHKGPQAELLLEPDPGAVLDQLVPMYLGQTLYRLMLEAAASELAARMTAMSNATTNASDMIDRLTLVYNKARQASITQELLEVVSGAEALG